MSLHSTMQPTAADDRATEFKPVEASAAEHFDGYTLLVEAYAAIWLLLMIWLVFLWRRQVGLGARIDGLESAIARATAHAPPGGRAAMPGKAPKETGA